MQKPSSEPESNFYLPQVETRPFSPNENSLSVAAQIIYGGFFNTRVPQDKDNFRKQLVADGLMITANKAVTLTFLILANASVRPGNIRDLAERLFGVEEVGSLGELLLGGRALFQLKGQGISQNIAHQTPRRTIFRYAVEKPECYAIALAYINAARLVEENIPEINKLFNLVKNGKIAREALAAILSIGNQDNIEVQNPKTRKLLVDLRIAKFQEPVITISDQQREKLQKRLEQVKSPNITVKESTATAKAIKELTFWLEEQKQERQCKGIPLEETRKQLSIILKQYVTNRIIRKDTVNNTKYLILPKEGESRFYRIENGYVVAQQETAITQLKTRLGYEEKLIQGILRGENYYSLFLKMKEYGKGTFYHYITSIAELGLIGLTYPIPAPKGNHPPLLVTSTGQEVYRKLMKILENPLEVEREMAPVDLYDKLTLWVDGNSNISEVLPALRNSIEWAANRLRIASEYYLNRQKPPELY